MYKLRGFDEKRGLDEHVKIIFEAKQIVLLQILSRRSFGHFRIHALGNNMLGG